MPALYTVHSPLTTSLTDKTPRPAIHTSPDTDRNTSLLSYINLSLASAKLFQPTSSTYQALPNHLCSLWPCDLESDRVRKVGGAAAEGSGAAVPSGTAKPHQVYVALAVDRQGVYRVFSSLGGASRHPAEEGDSLKGSGRVFGKILSE